MEEIQTLKDVFGFSNKKAKIYVALAHFGEMNVTSLSKRTNLKRTTIYNILPELLSDGFITKAKTLGKTVYYVESPQTLLEVVENRKGRVTKLVEHIESFSRPFDSKPKVVLYEGIGGMNRFYRDVLEHVPTGGEIMTYFGANDLDSFLKETSVDLYVKDRIKKGIRNRIIMNGGKIADRWRKEEKQNLREVKTIDFPVSDTSTDFKIYGNRVSFISYHDNFFAVTIENKSMCDLHKNVFETLWSKL
jgi:sugar-specific transcriptional regulator TrmB